MTSNQLTELEALLAKATPASEIKYSFYVHGGGRFWRFIDNKPDSRELVADFYSEGDRDLYYRVVNALPGLIKELREARASEDRLGALLEHHTGYDANCKCSICAALEAWKARKE